MIQVPSFEDGILVRLSLNHLKIKYGCVHSASQFSFIVDPFVPPDQWHPISVSAPESHHSMSMFCIDGDSMESINSVELGDSLPKVLFFCGIF